MSMSLVDDEPDLLIHGSLFHSLSISEFEYRPNQLIRIKAGIILFIKTVDRDDCLDPRTIFLTKDQFLIPGLVDTHVHASQYVFTGTGYDLDLLQWLKKYTFPRESCYADDSYAREVYPKVVRQLLKNGTTCASYFATIHTNASIILAETCDRLGQRAFVGKVNMDRNSPDFYIENTNNSIEETRRFVKAVLDMKSVLITPCITPRFVPTCTTDLMKSLGEIAKEFNLPIQSHLSETIDEVAWVKDLHPESESYTHVYDQYNLLTPKTIMAHCIHLSRIERDLMNCRGVGISHCASSNFCLASGTLNVRRLINENYKKIGLGTDVAGGYSPSMMDAIRQSIIASKVINIGDRRYKALNFKEAFHLATLGGAQVMNLGDKIGNFEVGKCFDASIIDLGVGNIDKFEHDDHFSMFEKFIYLGDDRNFVAVYVNGTKVV